MVFKMILYNKISLIALINVDFQIVLLNQLRSNKIYLIKHSIWVWINGMKWKLEETEINLNSQDIWIIGNEFVERELTWERKFTRFNISLRYSNNLPLFYDTTMDSVTSWLG